MPDPLPWLIGAAVVVLLVLVLYWQNQEPLAPAREGTSSDADVLRLVHPSRRGGLHEAGKPRLSAELRAGVHRGGAVRSARGEDKVVTLNQLALEGQCFMKGIALSAF